MTKRAHKPTRVHFLKPCAHPKVGALLPDYLIDVLPDSEAEEVEEHLLRCPPCMDSYLKVVDLTEAARASPQPATEAPPTDEGERAADAKVVSLDDFKK